MDMQLLHLRHAIQALYWPKSSATQQEADKWLQTFRNTPGAWDVCLALLRQPDLQDVEQEFATNTLKLACQKYQGRQFPGGPRYERNGMANYQAAQLHHMRRANLHGMSLVCGSAEPGDHGLGSKQSHAADQRGSVGERMSVVGRESARDNACSYVRESLRNVMKWALRDARSTLIPKDVLDPSTTPRVLQQLTALYLGAACQQNWKVVSQLSWAISVLIVRSPSWPIPTLLRDLHTLFSNVPQRPTGPATPPKISLLCTLYAATLLPEVCSSRFTSLHVARRQEVLASLCSSPSIMELIQTACCLPNGLEPQLLDLSWKLIIAWCTELGCVPPGVENNNDILDLLCSCALGHSMAADSAAECLTVLFTVSGPGSKSTAGGSNRCPPKPPASTSPSGSASSATAGMHAASGEVAMLGAASMQAPWAVVLLGKLLSRLPLLLEVIRNALRAMPGGVGEVDPDRAVPCALSVERRVLLCNVVKAAGVTVLPLMLGQSQKYQLIFKMVAEQLLSFLGDPDDAVSITSLEFWHEYLSMLLALPPPQATEAISQHRLLLQHLATCIMHRACLPDTAADKATADARDLPEDVRNMRRELASCLRDSCALLGPEAMLHLAAGKAEEQWRLAGRPTDMHSWGHGSWLQLESTLYASNVILGKGPLHGSSSLKQLMQLATSCLTGHAKLVGTALTLLGGLSWWFEQYLDALPPVLENVMTLVQHQDNKLARNAATALKRICSNARVSSWLAGQHGDFVKALVSVYHQREQAVMKTAWSDEQSTEELLLEALCHMVCMCPTLPASSALLHHLMGPLLDNASKQLNIVQQHLPQHTAAAAAATAGVAPVVLEMSSNTLLMLVQQAGSSFLVMARVLDNLNRNKGGAGGSAMVNHGDKDAGSPTSQLVEQLMPRMWEPLQLALALSVSHATLAQHLLSPCCRLLGACMLIARDGTPDTPSNMLRAVVSVIQQLPANLLAPPSVHKLMQVCVEQLGICVAVPAMSKRSGGSGSAVALSRSVLSSAPPHPINVIGPEGWLQLQQLAQRCLLHGCEAVLDSSESERWDSDRMVQLLEFAKQCGLCCPEVLHSECLAGPLLQVTVIACATFNADQCSAVLQWIPVLCAAAYSPSRGAARSHTLELGSGLGSNDLSVSSRHSSPAGRGPSTGLLTTDEVALAAAATAAQCAVTTALVPGNVAVGMGGYLANMEGRPPGDPGLEVMGNALEHGSGARLTLALLMAAAGNMPPDAVLPVANCIHSMWMLLGTHRLYKWLELAVRSQDTGPVPWLGLKLEARLAFVQDMLHPDNVTDVSRLKRTLKAFCGGKKKGR